MTTLRILVHALDRTGPPMLALALLRSLRAHHPDIDGDVVAFRGGELEADFAGLGPLTVMLRHHEPWDHAAPDPGRAEQLEEVLTSLPTADVVLLVSVAGGQCLPYLPVRDAPVLTWVVEIAEDLHWLDPPVDVAGRTTTWLAGSESSTLEVRHRVGDVEVVAAPEFIEPAEPTAAAVAAARARLAGEGRTLAVAGAGIGTWRKAPDLFVEVARAAERLAPGRLRFTWIGGETDPLIEPLRRLVDDLDAADHIGFVDHVDDVDAWLAAADVLCHPARADAFPLVCLHAAAQGTPVVAFSGVGGVPEMFGDAFVGPAYPDVATMARHVVDLALGDGRAVGAAQRAAIVARHLTPRAADPVVAAVRAAAAAGRS